MAGAVKAATKLEGGYDLVDFEQRDISCFSLPFSLELVTYNFSPFSFSGRLAIAKMASFLVPISHKTTGDSATDKF